MKFAITLSHKAYIKKYKAAGAQVFIVGVDGFSMRVDQSFSIEAIKEVITSIHQLNGEIWVLMNALLHETELDGALDVFEKLSKLDIDGIMFADLALLNFAKKHQMVEKMIYYPETYTTSYEDTVFFNKIGLKQLVVSREVTLDGIKTMSKGALDLVVVGHGFLNMFHSRRPLVENYFKHTSDQDAHVVKDKKNLKLVEATRDEAYPIVQDRAGTHIFRAKPLASFSVIDVLSSCVSTMVIDTLFVDEADVVDIIKDYHNALAKKPLSRSYDDHDQGFYFKETVTSKGGQ